MRNGLLKIAVIWALLIFITCLNSFGQSTSPVNISFDEKSKRIDLITGNELPDYKFARRGSFQFFTERLDEPEDVIYYFHDGRRTLPVKNLRAIEKFRNKYALWKFLFKPGKGRSDIPQYTPRIHTTAVSFIPLTTSTKEQERRVYVLLEDLKSIEWGNE